MKPLAALLLCAVTCPTCERPQEVELTVRTDSSVDLALACPHLHVRDDLGPTPVGPFRAHVGDTLLFSQEDAGFYYAESVMPAPGGAPQVLDRSFNLR